MVDIDFIVEDIERNVKISGVDESFSKIKISVTNNSADDSISLMGAFLNIQLLDKNKNKLENVLCYNEWWMDTIYNAENIDAFVDKVPANSKESGYLYCTDNDNLGEMLQVVSYTDFDEELLKKGQIKSTAHEEFFINLK